MLSFSWAILKSLIRIVPDERDVAFKTQSALYKPGVQETSHISLQQTSIFTYRREQGFKIEHQPALNFRNVGFLQSAMSDLETMHAICNV